MTKTVPHTISVALKNYDPLLRLRFSVEKKNWVLERKCEKRFLRKPVKYISDGKDGEIEVQMSHDSDVYIQYHDGYTDLRLAIPNPLPSADVFMETLYIADTARSGKYYVSQLTEQYEKDERDREIKQAAHLRELSSHAWNEAHFAGSRSLRAMKNFKS